MKDQGFLEAIRLSPEDDHLRLVYADWLEEHGDTEAAEFIRLQISLDRLPWWDARLYCANLRLQEIIENHPEPWHEDLPAWVRGGSDAALESSTYRRGLPSVIQCDVADWLTHGDQLPGTHPIEAVHFRWYKLKNRLGDWLDSPLTRRVKQFDLSGQYLSDDDLKTIASSPALAHVETLILAHNSFGDEGAVALAESPYLKNLRELDLFVTHVGGAGFRAITQSHSLPKLRCLSVGQGHSTVGDEEMRGLEASPHQFEKLIVYGTSITDRGVEFLCNASCISGLKYLDLGGTAITGASAEALAKCAKLDALEVLHLMNSQIGDAGAAAIGRSPCLGQLRYLSMLRCGIGPAGALEFSRALNLGITPA